ncbi:MAG: hypothetical protein Q4D82_07775 [Neisseria sp.]|nr:hypothetical protein [Neisseria sp.]
MKSEAVFYAPAKYAYLFNFKTQIIHLLVQGEYSAQNQLLILSSNLKGLSPVQYRVQALSQAYNQLFNLRSVHLNHKAETVPKQSAGFDFGSNNQAKAVMILAATSPTATL